ncbi:MAG: hypothetical protein CSA44_02535 [Gammaproteobacteria bacterium]|nr:MAG: hypothetical protein CSA44_02535 [Gammaproteobacteria bacterium]
MKKIVFIVLALLAIVVILPLSFNNSQVVEINYLFGKLNWPLSVVMLFSFLFGVLIALPFFALTGWGWKIRARSLQKKLNELTKQRKRDEIAVQFQAEKSS